MYMQKNSRYLDPLTNFGFKQIFGPSSKDAPSNKDILIEFLNVLFEGEKKIVDLSYQEETVAQNKSKNYHPLLSLICFTKGKTPFVLDIEHLEEHNFRDKNRAFITQFFENLSRKRINQANAFGQYYMLGFLKFKLIESLEYLHFKDICTMKMQSKEIFSGTLGFKFLEFANFNVEAIDLKSDLDKWLYLLKNMHQLNEMPDQFSNPIFTEVFKRAEIASLTREELIAYASSLD